MRVGRYVLKRASRRWEKILLERLTEPLHVNLLSAFVAVFGRYRWKIYFDLVIRQQYAFSILNAADQAIKHGLSKVTIIELGVAHGAGLINMCQIAERVSQVTGVEFAIVGFDNGCGLPPPVDYRDHPERFQEGDFPMNQAALEQALPPSTRLIVGDISETVPPFLATVRAEQPIAFVAIDVDYYSSAKKALTVFEGPADRYLSVVTVYLDDIGTVYSNPWCGELLAVAEFNNEHQLRKIAKYQFLRHTRICKNAQWIDKCYTLHVLDHVNRSPSGKKRAQRILANEYIS